MKKLLFVFFVILTVSANAQEYVWPEVFTNASEEAPTDVLEAVEMQLEAHQHRNDVPLPDEYASGVAKLQDVTGATNWDEMFALKIKLLGQKRISEAEQN